MPVVPLSIGKGFFRLFLDGGGRFRRLSRRLDFGERTPARPIALVIRLLCRVSGLSRLASLPLQEAFGLLLLYRGTGGRPLATL